MSETLQFALLGAALLYFWMVMFERFSRSCSLIGATILLGAAGKALKPPDQHVFFDTLLYIGVIGLLLARSWLIFKDWRDARDPDHRKDIQ